MHYKNGMSSVSSTTNGHVQHRILQDTVYGTHPIPGNYHLHMYFLFQANPASGEKYGHFNFLKFPHEDTTTTVDQKRTSQKLMSVKRPTVRHSTPENVKAFWTKWSGCIATIPSSNTPLPPPCDPPDDTPQQTSGDQPTDSGEAMEGVLLAKCVAETHEKENQAEQTDDSKTGLENVDTAAHTALPEAPTATTVLIEHASSPSTEEAPACEEAPMHKHDSPQQANTCKTINPEALAATAEPHAMQPPCEHQPEAPTATTGLMEHASNPSTEATTENDTNYERAEAFVRRLQAFQQHRVGRIDDSFESEEETIPSDDETPEPQGKDSQSVDDDRESMYQVWVVRLSGFEISMLFDGKTSAEMIMSWSAKKLLGTIYLMGSKPGCVVGTAVVKQQGPIKNFADLRATQWFTEASRDRRETWKNRMLKEEKPLYLWKLEEIKKLESPKRVPIYGKASCRSFAVSFGQLTSFYERALPGLDLCETTDYFRNLLSQTDLQKLHQTMKCLDGRVIRVGTTCSGTDIGVSTLKLTILSLAKHFGVTRRMFFLFKVFFVVKGLNQQIEYWAHMIVFINSILVCQHC